MTDNRQIQSARAKTRDQGGSVPIHRETIFRLPARIGQKMEN